MSVLGEDGIQAPVGERVSFALVFDRSLSELSGFNRGCH